MYLHLGQDTVVLQKEIVGIFDIENSSLSKHTKAFLRQAELEGRVITVSYEMPKSFIVCQHEGKTVVYISQISAQTLKKRAGQTYRTLF